MIRVNGQEEVWKENLTIQDYISLHGYRTNRIAVEKNGTIVPKRDDADILLEDGDQIEIVSFVGGG